MFQINGKPFNTETSYQKKKTCISVFLKINGNYAFYLKIHMFSFDQQQETWLR